VSGKKELRSLPDGKAFGVDIERVDEGYRVTCESPRFEATVASGERGFWSVLTRAGSYETRLTRENGDICVEVGGERFLFGVGVDAAADTTKRASARCEVKAPMPGKVVKLLVGVGDAVVSGQGVLLFEAMKMQNEIKSPQDGVVGEMPVEVGQAVEARDRLFIVTNIK
jgi:biotin carboxyl carrier protein